MWIALCGYAQSGKDTVAKSLAAYGYERVAFADPLKELALQADPKFQEPFVQPEYLHLNYLIDNYGWEWTKANVPGVREFLQNLGLGVRDIIGEDTWANLGAIRAHEHEYVVFTDARFANELDMIVGNSPSAPGAIVEVLRPGIEAPNGHDSEHEWGQWLARNGGPDYELWNDGTLAELDVKVSDMLRALEGFHFTDEDPTGRGEAQR